MGSEVNVSRKSEYVNNVSKMFGDYGQSVVGVMLKIDWFPAQGFSINSLPLGPNDMVEGKPAFSHDTPPRPAFVRLTLQVPWK